MPEPWFEPVNSRIRAQTCYHWLIVIGNYVIYVKKLALWSFTHGATASSGPGFTITFRHTTFGRTPLDEWSARHRDLYLTTHNIHYRHPSMLPCHFGYQTTETSGSAPGTSSCIEPGTRSIDLCTSFQGYLLDGCIVSLRDFARKINNVIAQVYPDDPLTLIEE